MLFRLLPLAILIITMNSCSSPLLNGFDTGTKIGEYFLRVKAEKDSSNPEGYTNGIRIDSPQIEMVNLIDKEQMISNAHKAILYIDYPLNKPGIFNVESATGFTKEKIVEIICDKYHEIYETELKTSSTKVVPIEKRVGVVNRNDTNGKYGICCHDIGDLVLTLIEVSKRKDGTVVFTIMVDS